MSSTKLAAGALAATMAFTTATLAEDCKLRIDQVGDLLLKSPITELETAISTFSGRGKDFVADVKDYVEGHGERKIGLTVDQAANYIARAVNGGREVEEDDQRITNAPADFIEQLDALPLWTGGPDGNVMQFAEEYRATQVPVKVEAITYALDNVDFTLAPAPTICAVLKNQNNLG